MSSNNNDLLNFSDNNLDNNKSDIKRNIELNNELDKQSDDKLINKKDYFSIIDLEKKFIKIFF